MKELFIVVHRNYADGMDAYAFWSEEAAKKSINADVDTVMRSLAEEGYEPIVLRYKPEEIEVYTSDRNIYYEWHIIISNVQ